MTKQETFISIDVETDGPIPGVHSMLSLGAAAFAESGELMGPTFECNLKQLPGATPHPETMAWWKTQGEAYAHATANQVEPELAMRHFLGWVDSFPNDKVCIAFPAGFDFMFVYWYLIRFTGKSPFSFSCLDIKTYVNAILKKGYKASSKKNWKRCWFEPSLPHTHKASDDAIEQGLSFVKMRAYLLTEGTEKDKEDAVYRTRLAFQRTMRRRFTHAVDSDAVTNYVADALWSDWNPISTSVPFDEYASYAPDIVLIMRNSTDDPTCKLEVEEYLHRVAHETIGLRNTPRKLASDAAALLVDKYARLARHL